MRVNKTIKNLETVWKQLDDACGSLDNALTNVSLMTDIPEEIKKSIGMIDFTAIVSLKNKIEEIIEEKNESNLTSSTL